MKRPRTATDLRPYERVVPRDLFQESDLLRCLDRFVRRVHELGLPELRILLDKPKSGFRVAEDGDGNLRVENLHVRVGKDRRTLLLFRPRLSMEPWDLRAMFDGERPWSVFHWGGELTRMCGEKLLAGCRRRTASVRDDLESIAVLGLSVRACNCLEIAGITTVAELVWSSARRLLSIRNLGDVTLAEIRSALAVRGLHLRDEAPEVVDSEVALRHDPYWQRLVGQREQLVERLDRLQTAQGWTDKTLGSLLLRFVESRGDLGCFVRWAGTVADAENEGNPK